MALDDCSLAFASLPIAAWPRWVVMWLVAVAIFATCKFLTWSVARIENVPRWRHWAYLLAWPGLDAARFLDPRRMAQPPNAGEWIAAALKMVLGGVIF